MSHVVTQFETAIHVESMNSDSAYADVFTWIAEKGAQGYELKSFYSDQIGMLVAVAQRPIRVADASGTWFYPS